MAVAELTNALRSTTLHDSALLFSPHSYTQWSELELSSVPRFLFRISTPQSDGFTDDTVALSRDAAAEKHGSIVDVFATQTLSATAESIADHLWWRRYERTDNLVSWSSSMLFVIRYIFYRHHDCNDQSSLADIHMLVIDTKEFPAHTFIQDLDLISAFGKFDLRKQQSLEQLGRLRGGTVYYFGEYLSQGSLDISGNCRRISAQTMIDKGLLDLHVVFQEAYHGENASNWVKPVLYARDTLRSASQGEEASLILLDRVFDIAMEFGGVWRLPIAIQLLALLSYALEPRKVYERVYGLLRSTDCEIKDCAEYFQQVHAPQSMSELVRAQSIMRALSLKHVQDLLLTAHTSICSSTQILAQYSGEPSVIADSTVQGTATALHNEYARLRRAIEIADKDKLIR